MPATVNSPTVASASVKVPSVDGSASPISFITTRDPTPAATRPDRAPRPPAQRSGRVARHIERGGNPGVARLLATSGGLILVGSLQRLVAFDTLVEGASGIENGLGADGLAGAGGGQEAIDGGS